MIGRVHAFYLFDVAHSIDLGRIREISGPTAAAARLLDKAPGPPRARYLQPPVVVDGEPVALPAFDGFSTRVKFYDYGVISLMLSRAFSGTWSEFVRLGQELIESEPLESHAADTCSRLVERAAPALTGLRTTFFDEDYLAFVIPPQPETMSADAVLTQHGDDIAQLLRGERQTLSRQEREEVLRHRLSYLTDDLVVPAWVGATRTPLARCSRSCSTSTN